MEFQFSKYAHQNAPTINLILHFTINLISLLSLGLYQPLDAWHSEESIEQCVTSYLLFICYSYYLNSFGKLKQHYLFV